MVFIYRLFYAILLSISIKAYADIPPFSSGNVNDYLLSASEVAIVKKLDGALSFKEFLSMFDGAINTSEEELYELWMKSRYELDDRFIVLKSFKGKRKTGQYIKAYVADSNSYLTKRNSSYLIFFRDDAHELSYSNCDIIKSYEEIISRSDNSLEGIIAIAISKDKLNCLDKLKEH